MTRTTKTVKIGGGADYAKVADRIKMFRQDCPNGSIKPIATLLPDGQVMFVTEVIKDLSNEHSGRGTGSAIGMNKGVKAFEKIESISVGRALAMLGYMADGEIATSEEMEEFEKYQKEKKEETILSATEQLETAKSLAELQEIWKSLGTAIKEVEVIAKKDELKTKLK
jgi:hypothetical protein